MIPAPALEIAVLSLGIDSPARGSVCRQDRPARLRLRRQFSVSRRCSLPASSWRHRRRRRAATGFWSFYTADPLAIFFKRFALVTTILVLVMAIDYAPAIRTGSARRKSARRARRIFHAADFHLRRPDVDGVGDRLRHDLRLARAGHDVVLRAREFHPAEPRDARGRGEVSHPERALDRVSGLRHHLDFRRDRRDESGAHRDRSRHAATSTGFRFSSASRSSWSRSDSKSQRCRSRSGCRMFIKARRRR